ncbi:MAG: UDP-N-acetylmuramate--L-alanine ligase [Fuerstiella sp.]|nr:UDP-N-acetylmuramate--L-alanine ligase [Fuerstiella sp.]
MTPAFPASLKDHANAGSARANYLLLGCQGAGMTALGEILLGAGYQVSGMDQSLVPPFSLPVRQSDVQIRLLPWSGAALTNGPFDVCVISPAVSMDTPIVKQLVREGVPVMSLHECLAEIFASHDQLCVAGSHGKSTTSAMLAWILEAAGLSPGFFVGAAQAGFECSGRTANHRPVVLESCEYQSSFRHFIPHTGVITGIERDHFDCYPNASSEDAAFQQFAAAIRPGGCLVYRKECRRTALIADVADCRTTTFSLKDRTADWFATDIQCRGWRTYFHLLGPAERSIDVELSTVGEHNVENALAAMAAAAEYGVDINVAAEALSRFPGIQRRFELRGRYQNMTLIDDYAHHPTAITATLTTARTVFPQSRILAVFEPHQIIRTRSLFQDFIRALTLADEVLLLPVFPAREQVTHLECCRLSGELVRELNHKAVKAFLFANLDQVVPRIDHSGRPHDVILTMGAGRTNLIHDQLTRRLQRHSVA